MLMGAVQKQGWKGVPDPEVVRKSRGIDVPLASVGVNPSRERR